MQTPHRSLPALAQRVRASGLTSADVAAFFAALPRHAEREIDDDFRLGSSRTGWAAHRLAPP
jgi:hypothetical protein